MDMAEREREDLIPTKKSVFGYGSRCSFVTWIERELDIV